MELSLNQITKKMALKTLSMKYQQPWALVFMGCLEQTAQGKQP